MVRNILSVGVNNQPIGGNLWRDSSVACGQSMLLHTWGREERFGQTNSRSAWSERDGVVRTVTGAET